MTKGFEAANMQDSSESPVIAHHCFALMNKLLLMNMINRLHEISGKNGGLHGIDGVDVLTESKKMSRRERGSV